MTAGEDRELTADHRRIANAQKLAEATAAAASTLDPTAIAKLDRIRVAWDQFFSRATDSRMRAETRISLATASAP